MYYGPDINGRIQIYRPKENRKDSRNKTWKK
jgi:hypothetical protein